MTDKDELTKKEQEGWAVLRAQADRLTPEQRERPEVNADGWSVRDVLWHIAHWWTDLARMFDEMGEGTFAEPQDDDETTNADNAAVLEVSRAMTIAAVEQGVVAARERMLSAWVALPTLSEPAERWFTWETIEHYTEHLDEVRGFADSV
jgi:uncharacterized damage-inducible protein DinB